ncbi:DapH/DapD/GlmU-related protein [Parabacteroides sp. AD58]|uniref:DapH/DapD/GlmU-related protein n=1 Tax=Parabacteroides absconsus TaxID=2951805 RepID=A0ABZ2IPR9_9BACT|nr:DapH/DapD/GlmU-related protein [Parabacteroides sp. AD58]
MGDESWLGYGSQIMLGVTIGKHCVIAAGTIVTKDIPDYSIAVGMPAKIIKQYNFETSKWEKN